MNLLLDTHVWIWSLLEPDRLRPNIAVALENPANDLWLSPISVWELLILVEKGRVVLECDPAKWLKRVLNKIPFKEAPLNHQVAIESRRMDLPHQDPGDRFLAATALVYNLTLVTADERLMVSKRLSILANK
jgi:PIN domain nuclease of toxin-antitoxin system